MKCDLLRSFNLTAVSDVYVDRDGIIELDPEDAAVWFALGNCNHQGSY